MIVDNIVIIAGYVHVGACRVSPDHNYLAYTVDISGGERFMLQVKDLRSGLIDPKLVVHGVVSLAWAQDASSIYYTMSDENQRPYRQNPRAPPPPLFSIGLLGMGKGILTFI